MLLYIYMIFKDVTVYMQYTNFLSLSLSLLLLVAKRIDLSQVLLQ